MIKVNLEENLIGEISYNNVNINKEIIEELLPIYMGSFTNSSTALDAIVIVSDLQGFTLEDNEPVLLGFKVASSISILLRKNDINPYNTGLLICGDLYANPNKRGGLGDVRGVWNEFNKHFKWVAGVSGNHDDFGSKLESKQFKKTPDIYHLENNKITVDKIKIAGLSGIIGKITKPNRLSQENYIDSLNKLLKKDHDILLLHETPQGQSLLQKGNIDIRDAIESNRATNIFCGHNNWAKTICNYSNGTTIVNCDSKVIIMKNDSL